MTIEIFDQEVPTPSDWLLPNGSLRLMPAAEIDQWSRESIRVWCHQHARYGLPTIELIDWLRQRIAGRSALEIGAGAGDLCRHLEIRGTDIKRQAEKRRVREHYGRTRQPIIEYPRWVEKYEAVAAVRRYKPEVVIASWVTHWVDPTLPPTDSGCSFGVREDEIVAMGCEYILIGNWMVHQRKPILDLPFEQHTLPFIRSRAVQPEMDRVFVWNAKR